MYLSTVIKKNKRSALRKKLHNLTDYVILFSMSGSGEIIPGNENINAANKKKVKQI